MICKSISVIDVSMNITVIERYSIPAFYNYMLILFVKMKYKRIIMKRLYYKFKSEVIICTVIIYSNACFRTFYVMGAGAAAFACVGA